MYGPLTRVESAPLADMMVAIDAWARYQRDDVPGLPMAAELAASPMTDRGFWLAELAESACELHGVCTYSELYAGYCDRFGYC